MHSYENALYLAAQKLRSLAAGQAYISYTDERGIQSARVTVPRVKQIAVSNATFAGIRAMIFSHSPSALPVTTAIEQLDDRERKLLSAAASLAQDSNPPDAAGNFRVKGPPKKPRQ